MEWSDLRIFMRVAQKGTLSAASRSLGLSQPTIGRRLRALELDLNRTLLQRTPQGLVLTEEGSKMLLRVEKMEAEARGIERQVAIPLSEVEGTIKIGSSEWFGAYVLPPVVAEFSKTHPRMTIELLTDHRLLSLDRRQLDVSFRIIPFDEPDVVAKRLLSMSYGVYCATESDPPITGDGTGLRLVTLSSNLIHISDYAWICRLFPQASIAVRSNNREVQAALCAQGAGIAVLPLPLGEATKGLRRLVLAEEPPVQNTWLGYHRDQWDSPIIRAFVDLSVRQLGTSRPTE